MLNQNMTTSAAILEQLGEIQEKMNSIIATDAASQSVVDSVRNDLETMLTTVFGLPAFFLFVT